MVYSTTRATLDIVREAAQPLIDGEAGDYDRLLQLIGEARLVLLGVETYGTHELFHARAELTKRLVQDRGFTCLALGERHLTHAATAPALLASVDRFVRGQSGETLAADALAELTAFPRWLSLAYEALLPHLEVVQLPAQYVLSFPDERIQYVYFERDGLVSLLVLMQDGRCVEGAMIGNEGVVGLQALLGDGVATEEVVQVTAGEAVSAGPRRLGDFFVGHRRSGGFESLRADHQRQQLTGVRFGNPPLADSAAAAHNDHAVGDVEHVLQIVADDDDADAPLA